MNQKKYEVTHHPLGIKIFYIPETQSTMVDAQGLIEKDLSSFDCVYTGFQQKGRGRLDGRQWITPPGEALLFTQVIHRNDLPVDISLVPLWCAWRLMETLSLYDIEAKIKWPNDLLVNSRKISGILCQLRGDYVFTGIGINLLQRDFPFDTRRPATSLFLETARKVSPGDFLKNYLDTQNETASFSLDKIGAAIYGLGERVQFAVDLEEKKRVFGTIKGFDMTGGLVLKTSKGDQVFSSGELIIG